MVKKQGPIHGAGIQDVNEIIPDCALITSKFGSIDLEMGGDHDRTNRDTREAVQ